MASNWLHNQYATEGGASAIPPDDHVYVRVSSDTKCNKPVAVVWVVKSNYPPVMPDKERLHLLLCDSKVDFRWSHSGDSLYDDSVGMEIAAIVGYCPWPVKLSSSIDKAVDTQFTIQWPSESNDT